MKKHLKKPVTLADFRGRVFSFQEKPKARVFRLEPVRIFLVQNIDRLKDILKEAGCANPDEARYLGIRADHATSTFRISKGPSLGVVAENLRVHETENFLSVPMQSYLKGAAVNPTLTLIALTEKLECHISDVIRLVA